MSHTPKSASEVINFPPMHHGPGSIGYVEKLMIGQLLLISQPRLVVETGTLDGHTTRYVADFVAANRLPACRIVSFDMPAVIEALLRDPYFKSHSSIQLVAGRLPDSLESFLTASDRDVDFAVVDATHEYAAVGRELTLIHGRLRPGAYVFCHDYREEDPKYQGVVQAVDEFVERHSYDRLPLNPSRFGELEVVWGAAVLRRPLVERSPLKRAYHKTGVAKVVELGGKALRKLS